MKKLILLFLALVLFGTAFAQEKLYLSLGFGAGFGTASTYDLYHSSVKVYPVALGKGLCGNLRAGMFLNDFIAVELGFGYRMGLRTKKDITIHGEVVDGTGNLKYSGNMLQIVPAVVISPDMGSEKIRPYARLGVIIGVMNTIVTRIDI